MCVEDPIECFSTVIIISSFELHLLNILYYYVNILLPLHYMDCVYTHHMYQPNHEAVACCETQNTRELFLQGSSTTDNAVTSLITKCSRTDQSKHNCRLESTRQRFKV